MRILLIKPKHIGDMLILTPTIAAIKQAHPEAEIWVLLRAGTEGILAGCPGIARVLMVAGIEKSDRKRGDVWRQTGVALKLLGTSFDYVFELGDGHRARLFAMLARTKRRYSVKTGSPLNPLEARLFTMSTFDWQFVSSRGERLSDSVSEFLPLPAEIPPLVFDPARIAAVGSRERPDRFLRGADGLAARLRALEPRGLARCLPRVVEDGPEHRADLRPGPRARCAKTQRGW
jgi:ADP-heptose:LPS heptosyltransferase